MNEFVLSATSILVIYCALVLLASLAGGWLLLAMRLTHARLQTAVSFVAGLMLGMALLHFIPHAFHQNHSVDQTMRLALGGFLVMFFLQRFFPHHHHDVSEGAPEARGTLAVSTRTAARRVPSTAWPPTPWLNNPPASFRGRRPR